MFWWILLAIYFFIVVITFVINFDELHFISRIGRIFIMPIQWLLILISEILIFIGSFLLMLCDILRVSFENFRTRFKTNFINSMDYTTDENDISKIKLNKNLFNTTDEDRS